MLEPLGAWIMVCEEQGRLDSYLKAVEGHLKKASLLGKTSPERSRWSLAGQGREGRA